MHFIEELPKHCPPHNAADTELKTVYRLIPRRSVSEADFKSHAALERQNKYQVDPCAWASCSLVKDPEKHIERWPKLKYKDNYFAQITIEKGSGVSQTRAASNHIHFWAYAGFQFATVVSKVRFYKAQVLSENPNGP